MTGACRRSLAWILVAGVSLDAAAARAADLQIVLPSVTVTPGSNVTIPIDVSVNPTGMGIVSLDFRMPLDPSVVQSSASLPEGFSQYWGPPFANATSALVAVAAAGTTPLVASTTRLNTVQLTLSSSAPLGTDMPLTFSSIHFNDGSPSVAVTAGVVHVRGALAAPPPAGASALALAVPAPDPAPHGARIACTLPAPGAVRLAILALDGARVRTLAAGPLDAGPHAWRWDGRDAAGRELAAGLYFVRLDWGGRTLVRRLAVVR